jgi:hypothetical protein
MWYEFLIVGGMLFYSAIGIELLVLFLFICFDNALGATISLIITYLIFFTFSNIYASHVITLHDVLFWGGIYLAGAVPFGVFYYVIKLRKTNRVILNMISKGIEVGYVPDFDSYKYKFISWCSYWPLYAIKLILGDLIKEALEEVYKYLSGTLKRIYDSILGDTLKKVKELSDIKEMERDRKNKKAREERENSDIDFT